MAKWQPDPTFYPSPRMAAKAPVESLAYVAAFDPDRNVPDAITVVDLDPDSSSYSFFLTRHTTTLSASSRSDQRSWPGGGFEHCRPGRHMPNTG